MLCFVPVLHGCVWYVFCYVRKKALLQCLAITERRDMGLYEVSLYMSLLGTMLANFHMCGIMLVLRALSCVFDSVSELFGETIRNVIGRGCYFVAECYGCV